MQRNRVKYHRSERVLSARPWTPLPVHGPYGAAYLLPACKDSHCIGSGVGVGINHHFNQWFEKVEVRERLQLSAKIPIDYIRVYPLDKTLVSTCFR